MKKQNYLPIKHEMGIFVDSRLSQREVDCLYWTMKGKTTKEIARILTLSTETVKDYKKSILIKSESRFFIEAAVKSVRFQNE